MKRYIFWCVAAPTLVVACTFGPSWRTIASQQDVGTIESLAATHDGLRVYVTDPGTPRLYEVDMMTGAVLDDHALWGGGGWTIVAMAPDLVDSDRAWSLSSNGMLVQWSPGLSYTDYHYAMALGDASERTFCDVAMGSSDAAFVTTVDVVGGTPIGRLWRRDATQGWGAPIDIQASPACPRVAVDSLRDEAIVLLDGGRDIRRFGEQDLSHITDIELLDNADQLVDIDALGGEIFAVGYSPWPDPPTSKPAVYTFDLSGTQNDYRSFWAGDVAAAQIGYVEALDQVEGIVAHAGSSTVQGIPLL